MAATLRSARSSCETASPSRPRASWPSWAAKTGDQGAEQPVVILGRVPEAVSEEMHRAALPRGAQHLIKSGLETRVGV